MPHGINAGVKAMKPPGIDSRIDAVLAKPECPQLPPRHHPVLSLSKPSDRLILPTRLRFTAI
jgi:hypothetical protein